MRTELVIAVSFMLSAASAAAIVFVLLKKAGLLARSRFTSQASALRQHPATAPAPGPAGTVPERAELAPAEPPLPFIEDEAVMSASPYAVDDETETPEAALTMNLINKKREAKKETIRDVMRRVHRRENPRRIAEALHVGIGEVDLAMTLTKLKK